jgi:hypothetical protein
VNDTDDRAAECVSLLLRGLVLVDGDRAVLRAGDTPYLTGPAGRRSLARHHLSASALRRLLRQLLPEEERDALARIGETRYDLCRADLDERFMIEATLTQRGPVVEVHRPDRDDGDYVSLDTFAPRSSIRAAA